MARLLSPGFEASGAWTFSGSGERRWVGTTVAQEGDYVGYFQSESSGDTSFESHAESAVFPVTSGLEYDVSFWVQMVQGPSNGHRIRIRVDPGDGVIQTLLEVESQAKGAWVQYSESFTAAGAEAKIYIDNDYTIPLSLGGSTWYVDDFELTEGYVAVKLAERVLDSLETLFQTNLSTELGLIDTDRNDGLTVPVPANAQYYKRPRAELTSATAYIELFEGSLDFGPEARQRFYEGAADGKAYYSVPVTMRATINNHSNHSADSMQKLRRRMQVGIFNVVSKNITPWTGDEEVFHVHIDSMTPAWSVDGENDERVLRVWTTVELLVEMEESQ